MSELRTIAVDSETVRLIEIQGERLLREGENYAGTNLLTFVLSWQNLGRPVEFHCDIDESAGLAEVVELRPTHAGDNWSRKT